MNPTPLAALSRQPVTPSPVASSRASGISVTTNQFTKQVIRQLLDGADAETFAAIPLASYGPWAEVVRLLREAYAEGKANAPAEQDAGRRGTQALTTVYRSLVRVDDQLVLLMAGDEEAPRKSFKMRELLTSDFPPQRFVIPGLIPEGLTILAGRPKGGKSWLVLQIAVAADIGGEVLGLRVPKLKVYYLAMEDTEYRLSDRLKKQTAGMNIDLTVDGEAVFRTDCSPLSEHGLSELKAIFDEGYNLVIVDTFSRILGHGDQMDQQEMTRVMAALQRMALDHHAAILLVDHHRKSARTSLDADPIDDILGSTAKAGVVDCALGLYRRHNEDQAKLKLSGRDFGDSELEIEWDPSAFRWRLKQGAEGPKGRYTLREREAIDAVGELGRATLTQLVAHLGQDKSNLYNRLQSLCQRGVLACVQSAKGYEYTLVLQPSGPASPPAPAAWRWLCRLWRL